MDVLNSIVRIMTNSRIGTGFVVSESGLIVTCAHVLGPTKPEKALVTFQITGEEREASVLLEGYRSADAEDVAFLQIKGALPAGVHALPLGSSQGTEGHAMVTFGYPEVGEVEGIRAAGTILGRGARTGGGQPLLQLHSSEITQGFSGSPVWDESRRRVIGIVVIVAERDTLGKLGEAAFAIPAETLCALFPSLRMSDICPYRNLEAFIEADSAFFFGRQLAINELVSNLQNEPRFLAIFGPSGCGKSSLVQAGLIPRLRTGVVPGSDRWPIFITRPTNESFEPLLSRLGASSSPTAIIIDQFEELFVTFSEEAYARVVSQLTHLLEHVPYVTLIIVMRNDFYHRFVQQQVLADWMKRSFVNIPLLMRRDELISIIKNPAMVVGLQFEDGLVETIVNDVLNTTFKNRQEAGNSTMLPLLEFALTQLWERRQDGMLTWNAYERIGGVTGGLSQWANQAYYSFEEGQRPLVRRIFTSLVHLGDKELSLPNTRRRRELSSLAHREEEWAEMYALIQRLVSGRLLVISQERENRRETIEIIHEALLWEWGLLRQWIVADQHFLLWHQKLEQRVREWILTEQENPSQRDSYKLLGGRDLTTALEWQAERRTDLSQAEQNFILASKQRQEQEEHRLQTLYDDVLRQRQRALARGLAAQAELLHDQYLHLIQRSVLLAVESVQLLHSVDTDQTLRNMSSFLRQQRLALRHEQGINAIALSPDGQLLATASEDGTAGIWNILTGDRYARLSHQASVQAVAFSPDGQLLATASEDGTAGIWNILTGDRYARLSHQASVHRAIFSPDGRLLATASACHIALWDVSTSQQVAAFYGEGHITAIAFSPDSHLLATAAEHHYANIWDVDISLSASHAHLEEARMGERERGHVVSLPHNEDVYCIAFSPDGRLLATGSLDHYARLWTVPLDTSKTIPHSSYMPAYTIDTDIHIPHNASVTSVSFSPDGKRLATTSYGLAQVQDIGPGNYFARLTHQGFLHTAVFSPKGHLLATISRDDVAIVWDLRAIKCVAILPHEGVNRVSFTTDGKHLITSGKDGIVRVWDLTARPLSVINHRDNWEYLSHLNRVTSVDFSPDGSLLATGSRDARAIIWNIADGTPLAMLAHNDTQASRLYEDSGDVLSVAFSPNGALLATTCADGAARIWQVATGRRRVTLERNVRAAVFSPDSKVLATASENGAVELWRKASVAYRESFIRHDKSVSAIAFSPSGKHLATGSNDKTAQVWDITTRNHLATFHHDNEVLAICFSPDGTLLATADNASMIRIWDIATKRSLTTLCHNGVHIILFSPDGRYLASVGKDSAAQIWDSAATNHFATFRHDEEVYAICFSPDGRYLATASADGTAGIWDISTGNRLASLKGERGVYAVAFSSDGKYLATGTDSRADIWLWRSEDLIARVGSYLTRNLTEEEWKWYMNEEPYRKTFAHLP